MNVLKSRETLRYIVFFRYLMMLLPCDHLFLLQRMF